MAYATRSTRARVDDGSRKEGSVRKRTSTKKIECP
jgi:hypothetical protein